MLGSGLQNSEITIKNIIICPKSYADDLSVKINISMYI